jgi:hypothetical protein
MAVPRATADGEAQHALRARGLDDRVPGVGWYFSTQRLGRVVTVPSPITARPTRYCAAERWGLRRKP